MKTDFPDILMKLHYYLRNHWRYEREIITKQRESTEKNHRIINIDLTRQSRKLNTSV